MTARAWDLLHSPEFVGNLNAEALYELCKKAGYSEEAAGKAASQRAYERLKRDLAP